LEISRIIYGEPSSSLSNERWYYSADVGLFAKYSSSNAKRFFLAVAVSPVYFSIR